MTKKILFFLLCTIFCFGKQGYAQTEVKQRIDLKWNNNPLIIDSTERMSFFGSVYQPDFGNIPLYAQLFSIDMPGYEARISFQNAIYIPLTMEYLLNENDKDMISDTLSYTLKMMPELNASNASLTLVPFRTNSQTKCLERLYCVDITVSFTPQSVDKKSVVAYNFPTVSPLANGDWYKLQITTTGVYKITGSDLKNMGMNIASIKAKNLKIYGLGGSMLPELNTETPNIGIQEQAIFVSQNGDNAFGDNDYILFYAEGPHTWQFDNSAQTYAHTFNVYSDYNFYYISATSDKVGKRIQTIDNANLTENVTTAQSDYRMFHEQDLINIISSGKVWLGEKFGVQTEYTFPISVPNAITSEKFFLNSSVVATGVDYSRFYFSANNTEFVELFAGQNAAANYRKCKEYFTAPASDFTLKISFTKGASNSEGWLDFFEIQARRDLVYNNVQTDFRDKKTIGIGNISKFLLRKASLQTTIWDVTDLADIKKMQTVSDGDGVSFKTETVSLREFIAFESANCYTPTFVGKINNQNLLGQRNVQSVIVAHPDFLEYANQLADEHRNNLGLTTLVVTPEQIYTEFSSGKQDVGAIRDLMRMLYLTAESKPPQYLLLFGHASYDYKNKLSQSSFVPTWEGSPVLYPTNSLSLTFQSSYMCDDFFALLDAEEGTSRYSSNSGISDECIGLVDIGVGRFPVKTAQESEAVLKKRLHYTDQSPETMGEWRNVITFVTDDPDGPGDLSYVRGCEEHEEIMRSFTPNFVIKKIYSNSYPHIAGSGGIRYPDVNKAINLQAGKGTLIMDYVGHGSYLSWANERILDVADFQSWKNFNRLPFVITETCSYAPFDGINNTAGELMFLHPSGGAIALFTTTRETGNGGNNRLIDALYAAMLPSSQNNFQGTTLGKGYMEAKRSDIHYTTNTQFYVLFGDPAMKLAFPKAKVVCTEINGHDVSTIADTLRSFSTVVIKGEIRNQDGTLKSDFNGYVYPTIFDKEMKMRTLGDRYLGTVFDYKLWQNIIFKGTVSVENGKFICEFFVPKDIDYSYGFSRMSFYASDNNAKTDATGNFENFIVGGINPDYIIDADPPVVNLYMNDTLFISGGYTDQNPVLLARLFDVSGINITGSAIGHNAIAILDSDTKKEIILNDFYETLNGQYTGGMIKYPFYNLSEGKHTLNVRVWDSYNNSSTASITFVVVSNDHFMMENMYAYPNPFSVSTNFVFEHNGSGETLDVTIRIFDLVGRKVKEIKQNIVATGYRQPIVWDGYSDGGMPVTGGYYVYQTVVKTSTGSSAKKSGKLVVVR